jgi:hypothetical protein
MGIKVEFNPDLALRDISEFKNGNRKTEECIPEKIEIGKTYPFLKEGQRNYYIEGEIPLLETKGNQNLSLPKASIIILEATHFIRDGKAYTKGFYKVVEIFNDDKIYFNGFKRI